ncbi:MAG: dockerin type I domain-containing protein [Candidatus Shapirobacteria bacterium]|nr:dockerin type I domain-containing protein [Candidatus Shapirobacteria bacterium]
MKQNKGISQIMVMLVMLVLAIALPITTRLVQKSLENRSKATIAFLDYAEVCTGDASCKPPSGQTSGFCTDTTHLTNWPSFNKGAPPVCSYGWGNSSNTRRNEACISVGGSCTEAYATPWGSDCKTDKGVDGTVVWNLCLADPYLGVARCCVPDTVYAQCGTINDSCVKGTLTQMDDTDTQFKWKCTGYVNKVSVECSAAKPVCTTGDKQCSGTKLQTCTNNAWSDTTDCGALGCNSTIKACNAQVCTTGSTQCLNSNTKQTCANNAWGGNETCTYGCSGGTCSNPICGATDKKCLDNILQKCNAARTGWETDTDCGALGCNSTSKTCNVCVNGYQKCSTSDNYFTCNDGQWSTSTTDCTGDKVCTDGANSDSVCHDPEYVAPKLNMQIALLGVGVSGTTPKCLGDIKLKINVSKVGQPGITREITATKVDGKFSTIKTAGDGYQVYQVSNFALDNTFALTDKIYINITGANNSNNLKLLTTLYGKNNQTDGFVPQDESQILVSSLVNNTLNLYNYPILNGDIGSETASTQGDGVINGFDFVHMKNQWNESVTANETLRSDLNGDCFVDSIDLQIYKNSTSVQYNAKTF